MKHPLYQNNPVLEINLLKSTAIDLKRTPKYPKPTIRRGKSLHIFQIGQSFHDILLKILEQMKIIIAHKTEEHEPQDLVEFLASKE